jgi:Icc-related predicted phosphoesterase
MKILDNSKQQNQRVLFAGDIHGDTKHAEWVIKYASEQDCTHIISVGDFGYWVHLPRGRKFVNRVAQLAEQAQIKFLWIDGNHENHDLLDNLRDLHGSDNPIPTPNEWVKWIPSGCRFDINGHTFMGFGGAYSVDWKQRELGRSYWRQELISPYHIDSLSSDKVDVLITHDAPFGKELTYKDDIPVSVYQRELVLEIQDKVKPDLHVCGHHHVRATWDSNGTEVHVLGRDTMDKESVLIRDFPAR